MSDTFDGVCLLLLLLLLWISPPIFLWEVVQVWREKVPNRVEQSIATFLLLLLAGGVFAIAMFSTPIAMSLLTTDASISPNVEFSGTPAQAVHKQNGVSGVSAGTSR